MTGHNRYRVMSNELGLITEPPIVSEQPFRVGIANKLITFAGDLVVIVALYVLTPNDSSPA